MAPMTDKAPLMALSDRQRSLDETKKTEEPFEAVPKPKAASQPSSRKTSTHEIVSCFRSGGSINVPRKVSQGSIQSFIPQGGPSMESIQDEIKARFRRGYTKVRAVNGLTQSKPTPGGPIVKKYGSTPHKGAKSTSQKICDKSPVIGEELQCQPDLTEDPGKSSGEDYPPTSSGSRTLSSRACPSATSIPTVTTATPTSTPETTLVKHDILTLNHTANPDESPSELTQAHPIGETRQELSQNIKHTKDSLDATQPDGQVWIEPQLSSLQSVRDLTFSTTQSSADDRPQTDFLESNPNQDGSDFPMETSLTCDRLADKHTFPATSTPIEQTVMSSGVGNFAREAVILSASPHLPAGAIGPGSAERTKSNLDQHLTPGICSQGSQIPQSEAQSEPLDSSEASTAHDIKVKVEPVKATPSSITIKRKPKLQAIQILDSLEETTPVPSPLPEGLNRGIANALMSASMLAASVLQSDTQEDVGNTRKLSLPLRGLQVQNRGAAKIDKSHRFSASNSFDSMSSKSEDPPLLDSCEDDELLKPSRDEPSAEKTVSDWANREPSPVDPNIISEDVFINHAQSSLEHNKLGVETRALARKSLPTVPEFAPIQVNPISPALDQANPESPGGSDKGMRSKSRSLTTITESTDIGSPSSVDDKALDYSRISDDERQRKTSLPATSPTIPKTVATPNEGGARRRRFSEEFRSRSQDKDRRMSRLEEIRQMERDLEPSKRRSPSDADFEANIPEGVEARSCSKHSRCHCYLFSIPNAFRMYGLIS